MLGVASEDSARLTRGKIVSRVLVAILMALSAFRLSPSPTQAVTSGGGSILADVASDAAEAPLSEAAIAARAARTASLPVPPHMGLHSLMPPTIPHVGKVAMMNRAQESGAEIVRLQLYWKDLEPEPGQYRFDLSDDMVNLVSSRGMQILGLLSFTPTWNSTCPTSRQPWVCPPKDYRAWGQFVKLMVQRYGSQVSYWEIWNEPNNQNWTGSPSDYACLLSLAHDQAKAVDPNTLIVLGGATQKGYRPENPGETPFMQRFAENQFCPPLNKFDYPSLHLRSSESSQMIIEKLSSVVDFWATYGIRSSLFVTEHDVAADPQYQNDAAYNYGEMGQADYYSATLNQIISHGGTSVYVSLRDEPNITTDGPFPSSGLLTWPTLLPRRSFYVYQQIAARDRAQHEH
jgi:hypothetical protein